MSAGSHSLHSGSLSSESSRYQRQTPTLLQSIGQSIWSALEAAGQRRAEPELHRLAQRWQSIDPAVAQQLRDAIRHNANR